ncbi:MAG: hypothetical protein IIX72_01915, partial [Oscillospiraceae bacterium]|nr:hypothetical protein [Oscillospiraceae bacterium]
FRLSEAAFGRVRLTVDRQGFDTPYYSGKFDEAMRIVSLYEKLLRYGLSVDIKLICEMVLFKSLFRECRNRPYPP